MLERLLVDLPRAPLAACSALSYALSRCLGSIPSAATVELCVRLATVDVLAARADEGANVADPEYPYLKVFARERPYGAQLEAAEPDALRAAGLDLKSQAVVLAWLGADGSEGELWFWVHDGEARHALFYEHELLPIDPAADTATVVDAVLTGEEPFADHWEGCGSPTAFVLSPRQPGHP